MSNTSRAFTVEFIVLKNILFAGPYCQATYTPPPLTRNNDTVWKKIMDMDKKEVDDYMNRIEYARRRAKVQ